MEEKNPMMWIFAVIVALILGAAGGYWYGNRIGYDRGLTDAAKVQAGAAKVKVDIGYKNPFGKVNLNPFK